MPKTHKKIVSLTQTITTSTCTKPMRIQFNSISCLCYTATGPYTYTDAKKKLCLTHENARPHTVRLKQAFLARHEVNVLPRPACSPDMNPIEHLCYLLGRKARKNHAINKINDLTAALVHEWNTIPAEVRG